MDSPIKDISAKKLMERWDLEPAELQQVPIKGYVYFATTTIRENWSIPVEKEYLVSEEVDISEVTHGTLLDCRFLLSDVEKMEEENPELNKESQKPILGKEKQELGQLRREKEKWDKSIAAAVEIGIYVSKLDHLIKREELTEEVLKIDDLPFTTMDQIWKAIPANLRKGAGRPPKK